MTEGNSLEDMIGKIMGLNPVELSDLKQMRRIQRKLEADQAKPDEVLGISLLTLQTFVTLWLNGLKTSEEFMNTSPEDMFKVGLSLGMCMGYRKAEEDHL